MPIILHLEGSRSYRNIVKKAALQKKITYISSQTSSGVREILKKHEVDLIITETELDDSSGADFLEKLNQSEFAPIPVIVVTAEKSMETKERFFSLGIVNYFQKNETLPERLGRYLGQFLERKSRKESLEDISCAILDSSRESINEMMLALHSLGITKVTPFESSEDLLGQKKSYDLYLIEILMPEMTGEEVVLELRRRGFHCVIIIVSTIQSRKTITHILRSGANDYIPKPFDGELGQARLRSHLRTLGMLQKQARRSTKLKRLASIDELTGVYNRRHTLLLLKGEMEKATRYNRDLTLLLLDIDHFKKVNDGYGHLTGDLVLRQFAKAAKAQCRDVDVFGRYGGEEFLLLMPETNEKNASILAERIRAAIASLVLPCMTEGITVSGGLVEFQGRNSNELISEADRRLYYAKEHGRNQIVGSNGPIHPQENGESA